MTLTPDLKFLLLLVGALGLIAALIATNHTADIGGAMAGYTAWCVAVLGHDVASGHFDQTAPGATPPQVSNAATIAAIDGIIPK